MKTYGYEGLMIIVPACVLVFAGSLIVGGPGELLDLFERTLVGFAIVVSEYVARAFS